MRGPGVPPRAAPVGGGGQARCLPESPFHQVPGPGERRFHCRQRMQRSLRRSHRSSVSNAPLLLRPGGSSSPSRATTARVPELLNRRRLRPVEPPRIPLPDLRLEPFRLVGAHLQRGLWARSCCSPETSAAMAGPRRSCPRIHLEPERRQEVRLSEPSTRSPLAGTARRCCSRRRSGRIGGRVAPVPGPARRAGRWTAAATAARPAASPRPRLTHDSPAISPACRYLRMRSRMRLSFTRRATRDIKMSWLTRSKNFSRSMSTTHR
jgi:hypothetical protein